MTATRPVADPVADRVARAALNAITEPGDPRLARLVGALGAVEVYERLRADTDLAGLRSETAQRLSALDAERVLEDADRQGIRFVVPGDDEWPQALCDLDDVEPLHLLTGPPLGLWAKGPVGIRQLCDRSVAVVGSRSATTYGTAVASDLAAAACESGLTVVSGAAYGIDHAAHRGAVAQGGATAAVLACGVDRAYPSAHRGLLEHIGATGLVLSELRPGCSPTRGRFLGRNRLIAALTQGTVVVEAAVRSGALNTASWANRLNRVVMAVPGPVTSAPSEGVHELIRTGGAVLVTRGEHILELLGHSGEHLFGTPRGPVHPRDRLTAEEQRVLDAVPLVRGVSATAIARTAAMDPSSTQRVLGRLAAAAFVTTTDGRWCQT